MILLADKLEKSFGGRMLFSGATIQINKGERYALVGPNGAGKTTMLKIIMGLETPDAGSVIHAKDIRVGYLEQETELIATKPLIAEVMSAATDIQSLGARAHELEECIAALESGEELEALLAEYGRVQDRFEQMGGYELETNARQILSGLGFSPAEFERSCAEFSGGWQMRIALAKLFLKHPDLLLLDEPTNHLDLESVQWLRSFIATYKGAVLIVSHDRSFMDACVDHVAALENRRVTIYTGNYSSYLKQREDNLEQMRAKRAAQERDIAHMQVFVDKFRYKPTKAAQAQERLRKIEQIKRELVILPEGHKRVKFHFPDPPKSGDMVAKLEDVSKSYGKKTVYRDVSFTLYRGDKVALVGPNGAGKSTLIKMLVGLEVPSSGRRELGAHVGCAYYAQHQLEGMSECNTVLQEIDAIAPSWTSSAERSLLGAFLFHGNDVEKQVRMLSGGERARLALAKMLVAPEALLCLDEPTNHLDIDSVDVLETALKDFAGTVVFISHDEHLVRAVATRIIDIRKEHVRVFDGDFDYYLFKRDDLARRQAEEEGADQSPSRPSKTPRASAEHTGETRCTHVARTHRSADVHTGQSRKTKEQRRAEAEARQRLSVRTKKLKEELALTEADMKKKRVRYDELMNLMADSELYADSQRFNAALGEYNTLKQELQVLEDHWLELEEALEREGECGRA